MLEKIDGGNPINNCNITIKSTKTAYAYKTASVCTSPTEPADLSGV